MKKFSNKLFIAFIIIISLFILPKEILFAQNSNIGFVSTNIWYSQESFSEGDHIKIYTLIYNQDKKELHGTVYFYDNETTLGNNEFILKEGESKIISIEWTVTSGNHTIFAKILNSRFLNSNGKFEEVIINQNESAKSERIIIKKILPKINDIENNILEKKDQALKPITKIENSIVENTPYIISKPLINTIDGLEKIRKEASGYSFDAKEEIKKDLSNERKERLNNIENKIELNENSTITNKNENNNILKPFKYIKLFFFAFTNFILNSKIIFYLAIFSIIFLILRFIWFKLF